MAHFALLVFATFFVWETLRFAMERYLSAVFSATRVIHPLVVVSLPLYVLWPDWVAAFAVAGVTGIVVATADALFQPAQVTPVSIPRRRSVGGLPPLP